MAGTDRPPAYQWFPRDFAAKMQTLGVRDAVELAYRRALDASWDSGAYGVGTLEEWLRWGRVKDSQATLKAGLATLLQHETQAQPDGTLVQFRMVTHRHEQVVRALLAAKHGAKGGRKSRGGKRRKPPFTEPTANLTQPQPPASAFASASASAEKEKTNTPGRAARGPEREPKGFAEFYESAYPRRDGRRAAAKAFAAALKRHPDYRPEHLCDGARLFAEQAAAAGTEPRFIPMPATWLNQDRFREFFDESGDDHAPENQAPVAAVIPE